MTGFSILTRQGHRSQPHHYGNSIYNRTQFPSVYLSKSSKTFQKQQKVKFFFWICVGKFASPLWRNQTIYCHQLLVRIFIYLFVCVCLFINATTIQNVFQSHIILHVGETVPEGVCPLVPAQLTADAVGDGGDKLSAQAELRAELQGKLLRRVLPLRHIPLKLVHQGDVPNVDVQLKQDTRQLMNHSYWSYSVFCLSLTPKNTLSSKTLSVNVAGSVESHLDDDPLVRLILQDAVCGIRLDLLSDSGGDGRDEGQRAEVQVVTKDLSEHLRRHQLL